MTCSILQNNMLHIKIAHAFVGVRNNIFHFGPLLNKFYKSKCIEFILLKVNVTVLRVIASLVCKQKRMFSGICPWPYLGGPRIMYLLGWECSCRYLSVFTRVGRRRITRT